MAVAPPNVNSRKPLRRPTRKPQSASPAFRIVGLAAICVGSLLIGAFVLPRGQGSPAADKD